MLGFGSFQSSSSSSSSPSPSILPTVAQSFIVDRPSILKPLSNDDPHDHPSKSSYDNWLHLHPPTPLHEAFPAPPSRSGLRYLGSRIQFPYSMPTMHHWEPKPQASEPHYSQYQSPLDENNVPVLKDSSFGVLNSGSGAPTLEGPSQVNYGQNSSESEYAANFPLGLWMPSSNDEYEQKKDLDLDLSWKRQVDELVSYDYRSSPQHGCPDSEGSVACGEASPDVGCGEPVESSVREVHVGAKAAGSEWLGTKFSTVSEENASIPPFNVSMPSVPIKPVPLVKPWDPFNQNASYVRCFTPSNSCMAEPTFFNPSTSGHVFDISDVSMDASKTNMDSSNGKGTTVQLNAAGKDEYAGTSSSSDMKVNSNLFMGSHQMKSDLPFSRKLTTWKHHVQRSKGKLTRLNHAKAFNSTPGSSGKHGSEESSSEAFHQINCFVDSPCWKGAPAPCRKGATAPWPFGVLRHDECNDMSQQNQTPINEVVEAASSPKSQGTSIYEETRSGKDAFSSFPSQTSPVFAYLPREHLSSGAYKTLLDCSNVGNECQTQSLDGMQELGNSHALLINHSSTNIKTFGGMSLCPEEDTVTSVTQAFLEAQIKDFKIDSDDAAQVGPDFSQVGSSDFFSDADISTGTAETVGASSSSGEHALPGLDSQVLVKMIHNISQLLLSNHYCDENALKDQDYEVLQLVISNLDAFSRKKVGLMRSMPDSSTGFGCSCHHMKSTEAQKVTGLGKSPDTGIEVDDIPGPCTHYSKEETNSYKSVKENDRLHIFSPIAKMGFKKDDRMVKAIKKVMEQSIGEQGEKHPETLVYKDLWIEAEATLCSMKYELRLAQMNAEMEKYKQDHGKDSYDTSVAAGKLSNLEKSLSSNVINGSSGDTSSQECTENLSENVGTVADDVKQHTCEMHQEILSISDQKKDVEASVMDRFRILINRVENKAGVAKEAHDLEKLPCVEKESHLIEANNLGFAERRMKTGLVFRDKQEVVSSIDVGNCLEDINLCMNDKLEDVESSVMAKFQILKNQMDNKASGDLLDTTDSGGNMEVRASETQFELEDTSYPIRVVDHGLTKRMQTGPFFGDQREDGCLEGGVNCMEEIGLSSDALEQHQVTGEFHICIEDGIAFESNKPICLGNQLPADGYDSPSSDWEHVLKDELTG